MENENPDFTRRVKEILDRLPLFVERTVGKLLFGYSNDETLTALVEVAKLFDEFGVSNLMLPQFFSSDDPDFSSYKNLVFSIVTNVSAFSGLLSNHY